MHKIIGTGLSGLVGSRIVELLPWHQFIDLSLEGGFNILKPETLEPVFAANPDVSTVIHLAAFTDTNAAWMERGDKKGLCYQLNVIGTQNLIDLCQKYKKYLIYISTDFVFDGYKKSSYTETDTPNPIEWYGETKYMAELLVTKNLPQSAITRIAFPYRARFDAKKDIVRKIIDGLNNHKLNPFFTDQITTPTFIDDIALSLNYFFTSQPQGIYHLVASSSQSPYQMAQLIAETFNFDINEIKSALLAEYIKKLPVDSRPWQKNLSISNHKIQSLDLKMSSLQEGLATLKTQI